MASLNSFITADPEKCIGCKLCEVACSQAHSKDSSFTVGSMNGPILPRLYLVRTPEVTVPVQCRHCEDAPCANCCPSSAIKRKNGAIIVDSKLCSGCKTCMLACPFGAIELLPVYENGTPVMQAVLCEESETSTEEVPMLFAGKCDLCTESKSGPACIEVCPENALQLFDPAGTKKQRNIKAALSFLQTSQNFPSK
ncbi:4Fe-4S dicluster domain-containing protein [Maridesulfovibrio hydrothermalis]|uniref:Putative electron transport protein n=1 Tax=Maridesulfovibrio hydrothermalis AM13 = DSM 14728 TaxID=1121451 RepID=L0RGP6_9BACT|nr:4Fe-4S dicluster domain-containing protein [Maridesulfovibrio hydrothermalis]CCO24761.1 putative electron transport protein [Maridesulfovibrio hydrothermalis AM13 = DSM 14728]